MCILSDCATAVADAKPRLGGAQGPVTNVSLRRQTSSRLIVKDAARQGS